MNLLGGWGNGERLAVFRGDGLPATVWSLRPVAGSAGLTLGGSRALAAPVASQLGFATQTGDEAPLF